MFGQLHKGEWKAIRASNIKIKSDIKFKVEYVILNLSRTSKIKHNKNLMKWKLLEIQKVQEAQCSTGSQLVIISSWLSEKR